MLLRRRLAAQRPHIRVPTPWSPQPLWLINLAFLSMLTAAELPLDPAHRMRCVYQCTRS